MYRTALLDPKGQRQTASWSLLSDGQGMGTEEVPANVGVEIATHVLPGSGELRSVAAPPFSRRSLYPK